MSDKKLRKMRVKNVDYDLSVLAENVEMSVSGETLTTVLEGKQEKLTAGNGIVIEGNVISANVIVSGGTVQDANNVIFNSSATYQAGSIGAALKELINSVNDIKDKGIFSSALTY